jgi:hypothetical protein
LVEFAAGAIPRLEAPSIGNCLLYEANRNVSPLAATRQVEPGVSVDVGPNLRLNFGGDRPGPESAVLSA